MAVENVLPPAGTPGIFDPRNPTLLPNFDKPVAPQNKGFVGGVGLQSPAAFLLANPRANAGATATFVGAATSADSLTVELTNPALAAQGVVGGKISHTYAVQAGDTLDDIAEQMADLFNDDANANAADISVDAAGPTLTFHQSGPVGNFSTLTAPETGPVKLTVGGTSHTGDVFNVLFTGPALPAGGVLVQANSTTSNTNAQDATALNTAINANATLSTAGISSTPSSAVLALTLPAGDYNVAAWVNSATPTFTIAGSPAAGNTVTATFTNAALPAGSHAVVYTVLLGATVNSIAAALRDAINADQVLFSNGITATASSAVVSVLYGAANGQLRISAGATGGGATNTASSAPTATLTLGTTATETIVFGSGGTAPTAASATALLAGTETDDDVISLVFTNANIAGFPVTISHTAAGSESINAIAAALNTAINANATLKDAGVSSSVSTATLTIKHQNQFGNSTVLSYTQGGNTETITFTPSNGHLGGGTASATGVFSGGDGPVFATNNFEFAAAATSQVQAFFAGTPYVLGYDLITQMVQQGMPIV